MTTVRAALSALLLYLVLIQPNHPAAMTWGALAVFPLELPALLAALLALGQSWAGLALRVVAVVSIWAIAVLKLADFGTFVAFNRGFNLVVDYNLVPAAWALARGSFGLPLTVLAVGLALIAALGLAIGLWWATGVWAGLWLPARGRVLAGLALVPALALAAAEIGQARRAWALPPGVVNAIPGAAFTARVAFERLEQMQATRTDLSAFRRAATEDALVGAGPLFDRLGTRDLVIVYVESYGRSSFENPLYIPTHTGTLRRVHAELSAQGLAMRSGWARAPMIGGQSWLSHGSVASGLWLDTQGRYRAMVASQRRTLFHLAQEAGFRTVAIKPAHVLPWPEGAFFGFDAIYDAADLGYRGLPFNWVTMPDQFTLHALDRLERDRTDRSPLVVQVALVSSHAPWVPIPELVDWDDIGDGTIFDQWAVSGDPPEVVWRDNERVRDQFRLAVDYSLQAIGAWAARHAQEPPLMIVMGDHEPARFVSGVEGFDVPVHVIGPEDLVARFEGLGWIEGLLPSPQTPTVRMDRLRDEIVERLSNLDRS